MGWGWAESTQVTTWPKYETDFLKKRLLDPSTGSTYNTGDLAGAKEHVYLDKVSAGYKEDADSALKHEFRLWLEGRHPIHNRAHDAIRNDKTSFPVENDDGPQKKHVYRDTGEVGSDDKDWCHTHWNTKQLTHLPGVREFLKGEQIRKGEAEVQLNLLAEHGPQSLSQAWSYFKHWVKRRPVGMKDIELNYDRKDPISWDESFRSDFGHNPPGGINSNPSNRCSGVKKNNISEDFDALVHAYGNTAIKMGSWIAARTAFGEQYGQILANMIHDYFENNPGKKGAYSTPEPADNLRSESSNASFRSAQSPAPTTPTTPTPPPTPEWMRARRAGASVEEVHQGVAAHTEEVFQPHFMFDPEGGSLWVSDVAEHNRLTDLGFTHAPNTKEFASMVRPEARTTYTQVGDDLVEEAAAAAAAADTVVADAQWRADQSESATANAVRRVDQLQTELAAAARTMQELRAAAGHADARTEQERRAAGRRIEELETELAAAEQELRAAAVRPEQKDKAEGPQSGELGWLERELSDQASPLFGEEVSGLWGILDQCDAKDKEIEDLRRMRDSTIEALTNEVYNLRTSGGRMTREMEAKMERYEKHINALHESATYNSTALKRVLCEVRSGMLAQQSGDGKRRATPYPQQVINRVDTALRRGDDFQQGRASAPTAAATAAATAASSRQEQNNAAEASSQARRRRKRIEEIRNF